MAINYDTLMAIGKNDVPCDYSDRDRMLYALATGFGVDPLNPKSLPYVTETRGHHTVPTMASTLAYPEFLVECGWDYRKVLHSEQKLDLYRPLPAAAKMLVNYRVDSVVDRGVKKGAVVRVVTDARLKRDDTAMFTSETTLIARGDGGIGGPSAPLQVPHRLPKRDPDLSCDMSVRRDQALLYRLTGDRNPLHADPTVARAAGFEGPILHGLCTYGMACHAVLKTICDYDFTLISGFNVKFSAPVYPGDTVTTDMWQDRNIVSFRSYVRERDTTVLNNGRCVLIV